MSSDMLTCFNEGIEDMQYHPRMLCWEDNTCLNFQICPQSASSEWSSFNTAALQVYITNAFIYWGAPVLGITASFIQGFGIKVKLRSIDGDSVARSFFPESPQRKLSIFKRFINYGAAKQQAVITHEVGHILGVHHSNSNNIQLRKFRECFIGSVMDKDISSVLHYLPLDEEVEQLKFLYEQKRSAHAVWPVNTSRLEKIGKRLNDITDIIDACKKRPVKLAYYAGLTYCLYSPNLDVNLEYISVPRYLWEYKRHNFQDKNNEPTDLDIYNGFTDFQQLYEFMDRYCTSVPKVNLISIYNPVITQKFLIVKLLCRSPNQIIEHRLDFILDTGSQITTCSDPDFFKKHIGTSTIMFGTHQEKLNYTALYMRMVGYRRPSMFKVYRWDMNILGLDFLKYCTIEITRSQVEVAFDEHMYIENGVDSSLLEAFDGLDIE